MVILPHRRKAFRTVSAAPSGPTDPYFSSVVLLLHADGSDGATSTTDNSSYAATVNFFNTARLSTTTPKYGSASLSLTAVSGSPTTSGYCEIADSNNWDFGTGDFTVECWFRTTLIVNGYNAQTFVSNYSTGVGWTFRYQRTTNRLQWIWNTTVLWTSVWTPVANTWYHVAICRSSSALYAFINGVSQGSPVGDGTNYTGATVPLQLGAMVNNTYPSRTNFITGNLDDIRITKGVARYTANFTPPSGPFPDS